THLAMQNLLTLKRFKLSGKALLQLVGRLLFCLGLLGVGLLVQLSILGLDLLNAAILNRHDLGFDLLDTGEDLLLTARGTENLPMQPFEIFELLGALFI